MSDQLTPGPWKLQPVSNGQRVLGGPNLRIVARVPAARDLDARLIAAAPDLLEACVAALQFLVHECLLDGPIDQVRAAIRTAYRAKTDG